ncbi:hypothetical protein Tsubulata_002534 [Turnera subulata]|uniref:Histone deacetylase interacting domain-containing protein n=1 Tax=Turnera subulata TaxID=218843 RepID=A0A9Q0G9D2_9ROSI|nr:hypothetical protein Tsubulata_002534 [Turnera subulata]
MAALKDTMKEEAVKTFCNSLSPEEEAMLEPAIDYVKNVKDRFHDQPDRYQQFAVVLHTATVQVINKDRLENFEGAVARVKETLVGHDDLVAGFDVFLQYCQQPRPSPPEKKMEEEEGGQEPLPLRQTMAFNEAVDFVEKIRVLGEEVYQPFSEALRSYKKRRISLNDACGQVLATFQDYPDLQEEFRGRFVPYYERQPSSPAGRGSPAKNPGGSDARSDGEEEDRREVGKKVKRKNSDEETVGRASRKLIFKEGIGCELKKQGLRFFEKVNEKRGPEVKLELFKLFYYHELERIGEAEFKNMVVATLGDEDLVAGFKGYFDSLERMRASLTEEDTNPQGGRRMVSKFEKANPSYRRLSKGDYPISRPKNKDEISEEVLNDQWESVPSTTQEYSCKRQNHVDQEMIEDDRFEVDMLETWLKSAIRYGEELLKELEADKAEGKVGGDCEKAVDGESKQGGKDGNKTDEEKIAEDSERGAKNMRRKHFLRSVEQAYGDRGYEVVDLFEEDASAEDAKRALPFILPRLKQKLEELKAFGSYCESIWKDAGKRH